MVKDLEKEATAQVKALEDAAFERGRLEGLAQGREEIKACMNGAIGEARKEAAQHERERIQAVEAQALPGHEGLIAELKFDAKTTGPEAAQRVLTAEKAARERRLANLKSDAPPPVPAAAAPPPADSATAEANLPLEERAKKQWDRDPELREEFGDNFKAFLAFTKADAAGNVRILSKKTQ